MPYLPKKECYLPQCRKEAIGKTPYCKDHQHLSGSGFGKGRYVRDDRYNDIRWRKLSMHVRRLNPICEACKKSGRVSAAEVTDHIVPWKSGKTEAERNDLFWDRDNLQALCNKCHNSKSAKERD
jgi:5-methylcytosine-specific restriction protein A